MSANNYQKQAQDFATDQAENKVNSQYGTDFDFNNNGSNKKDSKDSSGGTSDSNKKSGGGLGNIAKKILHK